MSSSEALSSLLLALDSVDLNTVEQEFSMVRSHAVMLKSCQSSEIGALKENTKKNRYKDILPYDESRVVLNLKTSESDGDYINASRIQGPLSDQCIAAQAPLASTLRDFWRMIWENRVKVIVMACREFEMAKKKCEVYWAPLNQTTTFGPFTVHCGESNPTEDMIVRELKVSFQQEVHVVTQLQFLSWPDHDVPHEAAGVLDLLHRVQDLQGPAPQTRSPKLVHCSAGCGRTGVICALDHIYQLLMHQKLTSDFSILKIVMELRRQRPSVVQTKDQYRFVYRATSCLFRWFLQKGSKARVYHSLSQAPKPKNERVGAVKTKNRSPAKEMEATYAVVNKKVAAPQTPALPRDPQVTHHYDNLSVTAAPVYSVVRPRAKPSPSEPHLYDMAKPTSSDVTPHYHLLSGVSASEVEDDYEDFTPSTSDSSSLAASNGIGFNKRVPKPRGPRDPPAEWSRLER